MKHIPILRTRRLTAQLKELAIGDAIAIAGMPDHLDEAGYTAFLKAAIAEVITGEKDPVYWTVQERALAVAHYLAAVMPDGPDFSVSGQDGGGKYSDYLDGAADISIAMKQIEIGKIGGDQWELRHLTGAMAESIERLAGEFGNISPRLHWVVGGMAAQLIRTGETLPDLSSDGLLDEWLLGRMRILLSFPESDFEQLMIAYRVGRDKLHHLFSFDFDEKGIVILPKGGAEGDLPPARFPVYSGLSNLSKSMAGKPNRIGGEP